MVTRLDVAVRDVPHSLRHIFHLLSFVKSCKYKLFSNGAGKHFLSALLGISVHFEFGKEWCAIHSTTNDPRSDWCGIKAGGGAGVSGVADVVLQNMSSDRLVDGEVKLTPEGGRESIPGENQLIAELKAVQQRQARQSIDSIIPPLPGPPVPLQFTKAVKIWFSALVEKHSKASYDELVPKLKTGNPPLVSDPYMNFC